MKERGERREERESEREQEKERKEEREGGKERKKREKGERNFFLALFFLTSCLGYQSKDGMLGIVVVILQTGGKA